LIDAHLEWPDMARIVEGAGYATGAVDILSG
jgi:hypothetical protein